MLVILEFPNELRHRKTPVWTRQVCSNNKLS